MSNSNLVQSVVKALDILHTVSSTENGMQLNELSESFGMKKTTVHNLVRTLRARHYLTKDNCNRYQIGPAVTELLSWQYRKNNLRLAGEQMRELHKRLPESTVTFSELCGMEIYCRLRIAADQPGLLQKPVAMIFPPYNSATGICIQAFHEEYHSMVLEKYPFNEFATRKWQSLDQFEKLLGEVRKAGYYLDCDHRPGIRIAFPCNEYFAIGANIFECNVDQVEKVRQEIVAAIEKIKGDTNLQHA